MLTSQRLSRRLHNNVFSRVFMLTSIVFIISVLTYFIFFTGLVKKHQPQIKPDIGTQHMPINLLTYEPSTASDSATTILHEMTIQKNFPFQVLSLDADGQLTELNLIASSSAQANLLISDALPNPTALKNFYLLHKLLTDANQQYKYLWATSSYFVVMFFEPFLVVFPGDISPAITLNSLQQIRSQSTMNLTGAIIDLRFVRPIILPDQIHI